MGESFAGKAVNKPKTRAVIFTQKPQRFASSREWVAMNRCLHPCKEKTRNQSGHSNKMFAKSRQESAIVTIMDEMQCYGLDLAILTN